MMYILFGGSFNDFIINIGNIHNECDVILKVVGHDTSDDIKGEVGTGVAHVTGCVHGRTAPEKESERE